jgi:hypothetical protein
LFTSIFPDRLRFAFTTFLSAFLLFWVQFILGKFILPWFGGTPAVWTTCILFFQWLLLAGYVYAHILIKYLKPTAQASVHGAFLAVSVATLFYLGTIWISPITPGASWKPTDNTEPVLRILALLAVSVGLPYFALSATSPLLQAWYRHVDEESAYRLYAISNGGSFLALFAFPFLLEPALPLPRQGWYWSVAYAIFAVTCLACAVRAVTLSRKPPDDSARSITNAPAGETSSPAPARATQLLWFAFSASASAFFLATTNQLCQDVAVVPLLWVLPLSVYLLSFILCFEHPRWYARNFFHILFALSLCCACFVLFGGALASLPVQIALYLLVLFAACMVCHGELARIKPATRYLTTFYLCIALGGALGGMFVALLAPAMFHGFWEYHIALLAIACLLLLVLIRDPASWLYQMATPAPVLLLALAALLPQSALLAAGSAHRVSDFLSGGIAVTLLLFFFSKRKRPSAERARHHAVPLCSAAAMLVLGGILVTAAFSHSRLAILRLRNFYGTLAVVPREIQDSRGAAYSLVHGRVVHGFQLRTAPYDRVPTSYYAPKSGVGLALAQAAAASRGQQRPLKVGIIGLGIGTVAAYAAPGDTFRFYEINPQVISVAGNPAYFTYLAKSAGSVQIVPGDARLSLESEAAQGQLQNFDVMVLDAFSGDAVPAHLLTLEAFALYRQHLRQPDGILAVHITNTYLDLRPVVLSAAAHYHLKSVWIHAPGDGLISAESEWILLSEGTLPSSQDQLPPVAANFKPWTDDYSNLFRVLRR